MTSALEGTKVLDLAGMGPAFIAATMLGDMGAEVVKISTPPGAASRGVGAGIQFIEGVDEPSFLDTFRNEKNIGVNLKAEAGKRLFRELARTSDVVIESFRPGVMDRLGIGYTSISEINPRIIYCSISGYGQDGPYRDLPGHDANYAAMGGALGLIGYSNEEPPVLVENILADVTTAVLQAVIGILAALHARGKTGRGQLVDISMTDGVFFTLSTVPEVGEYLMKGTVPERGQAIFGGAQPCYAVYKTRDGGYLTIGALEPHFWRNLCKALGREDLIPLHFAQSPKKEEVFEVLRQIFRTKSRDEWFELLTKADVPAGKVLGVDEVCNDPHMRHRRMIMEVDHPRWGKARQIGFPIKFSETPCRVRIPAARIGDHTNEVLSGLGYSAEEIKKLRLDGAVC
ncbi:MAG: CoA transferase [Chloroflexi bacterium]|nr:CoA transferase [Chloroflexota bacterium]